MSQIAVQRLITSEKGRVKVRDVGQPAGRLPYTVA